MSACLEIHYHTINESWINELHGSVPPELQIRFKLNDLGFKFEDDGDISLVTNFNPQPLGEMTTWYEPSSRDYHFRQIIRRYKEAEQIKEDV